MARHNDLAHAEIAKAYDAFGSDRTEPPSGDDRILIVLDLLLHRMNDMSGNGGKWSRVKKQGPTALGGAGLATLLLKGLEILV